MSKSGIAVVLLWMTVVACTASPGASTPGDEELPATTTDEPAESVPIPTQDETDESLPTPQESEAAPADVDPTPTRIGTSLSPRLESRLAQIVVVYQNDGLGPAQDIATSLGIAMGGNRVMVVIAVSPQEETERAARVVEAAGGSVEGTYADQVQAWVPLDALNALASESFVRAVMPVAGPVPSP